MPLLLPLTGAHAGQIERDGKRNGAMWNTGRSTGRKKTHFVDANLELAA